MGWVSKRTAHNMPPKQGVKKPQSRTSRAAAKMLASKPVAFRQKAMARNQKLRTGGPA